MPVINRRAKKRYMYMHVFQALQLESVPRHKHAFSAEFEEKKVDFFKEMIVFIAKRSQNILSLHTRERYCRSLHESWALSVSL